MREENLGGDIGLLVSKSVKKGGQAPGHSSGGMSTKIHTVAVSEHRVLEVFLSGGYQRDAPVGKALLGEALVYEETKAVAATSPITAANRPFATR